MHAEGLPKGWLDAIKEVAGDMLWDIVVRQVELSDWRSALEGVRLLAKTSQSVRLIEDIAAPIEQAFDPGDSEARIGLVLGDEAEVHAHFFAIDEIEFDVDPTQLQSRSGDALLEFMRAIGRSTLRPCLLTPENVHDRVLLRYDPVSDGFSLN